MESIRGAITVEANTEKAIEEATIELLNEIFEQNGLKNTFEISHIIFTTTKDLNAAFPAKFPRTKLGWNDVAMMCFHELDSIAFSVLASTVIAPLIPFVVIFCSITFSM